MEAYRDQYATIFNSGRDVVVIAISSDADTTLAAWARQLEAPQLFVSDSDGRIGQAFGVWVPDRRFNRRAVFVIDPEGRISYSAVPFRELSADAYVELGDAVSRTMEAERH